MEYAMKQNVSWIEEQQEEIQDSKYYETQPEEMEPVPVIPPEVKHHGGISKDVTRPHRKNLNLAGLEYCTNSRRSWGKKMVEVALGSMIPCI